MDEVIRKRLHVDRNELHDFKFNAAGWLGEFIWAWNATEIGYRGNVAEYTEPSSITRAVTYH
jgi:hypothetical protein